MISWNCIRKLISGIFIEYYGVKRKHYDRTLRYACELAGDLKADLIVTNVINQRGVDMAHWSELSLLDRSSVEKFIDHQKKIDPMKFKKKLRIFLLLLQFLEELKQ